MRCKFLFAGSLLMLLLSNTHAQIPDTLAAQIQQATHDSIRTNLLLGWLRPHCDQYPSLCYQEAHRLLGWSKKLKDKNKQASAQTLIGVAQMSMDSTEEALATFNKTISLLKTISPTPHSQLGHVYNNMGVIYYRTDRYEQATDWLHKSWRLQDSIKDTKVSSSLNNLGLVYDALQQYDSAYIYYERSLAIKEKKGDAKGCSNSLNNIGIVLRKQKRYDLALKKLQLALHLADSIGNLSLQANAMGTIAKCYQDQKLYEVTEQWLLNTAAIYEQVNERRNMLTIYNSLAENYIDLSKPNEALLYLEKAEKLIAEGVTGQQNLSLVHFIRCDYYQLKGDYKQALLAYKQGKRVQDSLYRDEKNRALQKLRNQHESYRKEQQITFLEKDNLLQQTQLQEALYRNRFWWGFSIFAVMGVFLLAGLYFYRSRANKILLHLNETKDKLFTIIAHDLKNPLSAFRSITQSLTENYEHLEDAVIRQFLQKLNNSAGQVYDLLQNLLVWAISQTKNMKIQQQDIKLHELVEDVFGLLESNAALKNIALKNEVPTGVFVFFDVQSLKTILRNLVANAIKFSQPNGRVWVAVQQEQTSLRIAVCDNGIGINAKDQEKLFKTTAATKDIGKSKEKGTGLGLLLCQELAKHNKAEMAVESEEGKGSCFYVIVHF